MAYQSISGGLTIGAVIFLTPLIMRVWRKLAPPRDNTEFDGVSIYELKHRNKWIYLATHCLSTLGIFSPIILMMLKIGKETPWLIGLGFGLAIILPFTFATLLTLPRGKKRFLEFWRYFELENGLSLRSMVILSIPLATLGFVSIYNVFI
jgi:hypothetical protein